MDEKFEDWWTKIGKELTYGVCDYNTAFAIWQAAQPQWQPIETAPRDGTDILGFKEGDGVVMIFWVKNLLGHRRWVDS